MLEALAKCYESTLRRLVASTLILLGLAGLVASGVTSIGAEGGAFADRLTIDGTIDRISAHHFSRGVERATKDGAALLIVVLDTPGGLLDSTFDMVEEMLSSRVPIVTYVAPPGAQAASAGTFITAAAHVAAMSPGTSIGAASPVGSSGKELPATLKNKATQFAAAKLRSIAEERGRNQKALEDTVLRATSYSASEALNAGIIDLIASDMPHLLDSLDGRVVVVGGREVRLETKGIEVRSIGRTPVERFLGVLANPNIAFLLLTVGGLGILIELFNPGTWVPGIAGAIALALAFLALGNLPVNWAGVGLIGFAMVLFFLELQAPGFGAFGIGGAVSFIAGAFLLFGEVSPPAIHAPSFKVSLWVIGVASGLLFAMLLTALRGVVQARRAYEPLQQETLVGREGTATTDLNPHGTVQVASELWSAVSDGGQPISKGEAVIVLGVEGLTARVSRPPKAGEQEIER